MVWWHILPGPWLHHGHYYRTVRFKLQITCHPYTCLCGFIDWMWQRLRCQVRLWFSFLWCMCIYITSIMCCTEWLNWKGTKSYGNNLFFLNERKEVQKTWFRRSSSWLFEEQFLSWAMTVMTQDYMCRQCLTCHPKFYAVKISTEGFLASHWEQKFCFCTLSICSWNTIDLIIIDLLRHIWE